MRYEASNYRHNRIGTISCDVDHPIYGVVPYGLDGDDLIEVQAKVDSGEIVLAPYVAPE